MPPEAADVVADFLLARMLAENVSASQSKDKAKAARRILKPYYHNIRITESGYAELIAALGKNRADVFVKQFGNTESKGISIDGDVDEINDCIISADIGLQRFVENICFIATTRNLEIRNDAFGKCVALKNL